MAYNPALIPHVSNVAALLALPAGIGTLTSVIYLDGYYAPNDGGEGVLEWNASSSATANNGTIFTPTGSSGNGRWIRQCDNTYSVLWFGAKNDGSAPAQSFILAAMTALAAAGGGSLFYPPGDYQITGKTDLASNVNHFGVKFQSRFVIPTGTSSFNYVFNASLANISNVAFDGLSFDDSANYPTDSKTYKSTMTTVHCGIRVGGVRVQNFSVTNCAFFSMSLNSIDIETDVSSPQSSNILIERNYFNQGSYQLQCINIRVNGAVTGPSQYIAGVKILDNYINTCGPQYYWKANLEDWTASTDGISAVGCFEALICGNTVLFAGSSGIRCERSVSPTIIGNNIDNPGASGIITYNHCINATITANQISNWGRTPVAFCIQSYSGAYYNALEFMKSTGPTLPANPSSSGYFQVWPYSVDPTKIDVTSIVAYSDTNYYTGTPSVGILPFRGYAAINYTQDTVNATISGNVCSGDLSVDGSSKNIYASDYGASPQQPVNAPVDGTGDNCFLQGNVFQNCRVYQIWHPQYVDVLAASGVNGFSAFIGNDDNNCLIDVPRLWIQKNGTVITGITNFQLGAGVALATTATLGFPMMPTVSGTPTGTPVGHVAGTAAFVFDSSATKLWVYKDGTGWKSVALT